MYLSGSHSSLLVRYVHSRARSFPLTYRAPSGGKSVSTTTGEELILRDSVSLRVDPRGIFNNLESQSSPFVSSSVFTVLAAIRIGGDREKSHLQNHAYFAWVIVAIATPPIKMAERKATNKYYPPQWTPSHGSLNKFQGSHPLRERARKIHQGIIGVRFELPFNIWCNGCGSHVGMGVRYNAEKSQVGKYYSTPIFKFRMKCHLCDNYFEIETDPKNHDYVVTTGASRKNERYEHEEGVTASIEGKAEKQKMESDPMFKLEHTVEDKEKSQDETPRIQLLQ
uniref:Coiled-coil domain-containing protein 130 n=1 Tax=Amphimedon queenslandica TaxID=400682 RepID=A0A1X7STU3_AMPQE